MLLTSVPPGASVGLAGRGSAPPLVLTTYTTYLLHALKDRSVRHADRKSAGCASKLRLPDNCGVSREAHSSGGRDGPLIRAGKKNPRIWIRGLGSSAGCRGRRQTLQRPPTATLNRKRTFRMHVTCPVTAWPSAASRPRPATAPGNRGNCRTASGRLLALRLIPIGISPARCAGWLGGGRGSGRRGRCRTPVRAAGAAWRGRRARGAAGVDRYGP